MTEKRRKKKIKKIKYRKVTFKLTDRQKKLIEKVCKIKKTTPTRMMKAAIRDYLQRYAGSFPEEDFISENQLKLFDDVEFEEVTEEEER